MRVPALPLLGSALIMVGVVLVLINRDFALIAATLQGLGVIALGVFLVREFLNRRRGSR
ncbi:hypothetical protein MN032_08695 [Agromyces atrinae]|uniref:Uncharacterized protein n=1 Tax=Agromyces atrinae TaxID=592376 RepID=A0A852SG98_9MICO|nr:hypothetical protein [Agromyces atrinae]MCI2957768.1 hypothetical protein [Agromyces atrinae]NYD66925.1 hypothetical protein [Agromyces atrinae]